MKVKFSFFDTAIENSSYSNCVKCKEYKPTEKHHVVNRSAGGHSMKIVRLCNTCHRWVTLHPKEAHGLGLHLSYYETKEYAEKYKGKRSRGSVGGQ